jgi:hypothetical protein
MAAALATAMVTAGGLAQVASAAPSSFMTGFTSFGLGTGADANVSFNQTAASGARFVVLFVHWAEISPQPPPTGTDPANPANPEYRWDNLDEAVRGAAAHGLTVVLSVGAGGGAPWADGPRRPPGVIPGTWRPSATAFGAFVKAVARRYSGTFNPGTGTLPRVRYFQAWSEPNLDIDLAPAWVRVGRQWVAESPIIYRGLLNAAYAAVKSIHSSNVVITGGTAPYGDYPGGHRVPPVVFVRELLCLHGEQLKPERCPNPAHFDILDHHPYSVAGPWWRAINRNDVALPDMWKLRRVVAKAQTTGRALPRGQKRLWVLEFAWDSSPPDSTATPMNTWEHWMEESFYVLWSQGVTAEAWFLVRDLPCTPSCDVFYRSGIYFVSNQPKPGFEAFRFPFVVEPAGGGRAVLWGITPDRGTVLVQLRRGGRWHTIATFGRKAHAIFTTTIRLSGRPWLRARVGDETSVTWQFR